MPMQTPLLLGATTFLLSLFLTPAFRYRFRRKPAEAVPRIGGVPIALASFLGSALVFAIQPNTDKVILASPGRILQLFAAATFLFVIGLIDDLKRIEPWHKMTVQLVVACLVYWAGVRIQTIAGLDIGGWSLTLTVIWILVCTTAMNLMNHIDDLAVGIGILATSAIAFVALLQNNLVLEVVTIPLGGSLLGFLPYNFRSPKMRLGESGSLLIGLMLGCYTILWSQRSSTAVGVMVPLLVLSVPLLDTALVIVGRFLRRQPLGTSDRSHIYHRLLSRGLTPRKVALVLYVCAAIGAIVSVLIVNIRHSWMMIILFYGAAWIWIRKLGYIELRVAGRMLMQGDFLRQLHAEVILASYESRLTAASTPEEYWTIVVQGLKEFGFHEAQLAIANASFEWHCNSPSFGLWEITVPIADFDCLRLSRAFGTGSDANGFAPFIDIVRRSLTVKRGVFLTYSRALDRPHLAVGG